MRLTLALLLLSATVLSACVPVAIGATAAVVADQEKEKQTGGDGYF